ncbi:MAG TPA: hypothetical protein VFE25_09565 [Opitutaceae bacterium]|jgi:hypothetical protein|nr:hypothetical protein [Opitutaceae bacterium]
MTRQSAPWIGLGLVLLAACAASYWLSGKAEKATSDNQALVEKQVVLNREIVVLKRKLAEAESKGSEVEKVAKTEQPNAKKPENPALQEWQHRFSKFNHRSMLRSTWYRYHDVIAKLNLPTDKQAQLVALMTTKWEATVDANDAANSQGITDQKEIDAASKQAADEVNTEIVGLIGQANDNELQHGEDLVNPKGVIERNIGPDFQMGGVPLSADQENAVAEIYLDGQKHQPPADPNPAVNLLRLQQTDAAYLEKASSVLSPEQMTILKDYFSWNEERAKTLSEVPK